MRVLSVASDTSGAVSVTPAASAPAEPPAPLSAQHTALLAELHRDSGDLAAAVTGLLASLRDSLARSAAGGVQHSELYRRAAAGVAAETRDVVGVATAFVEGAQALAGQMATLERFAEQTRVCRAQLDALEAAAAKVLPAPPPRPGGAS